MALFDMPPDQLYRYRPESNEPADFDTFWAATLNEARHYDLNATFEPMDCGLQMVETFDVSFNGYGGAPDQGLAQSAPRTIRPCVVECIGYSGGRGFPTDWLLWSAASYAHLVMDTRGQATGNKGDTPDSEPAGVDPHYPGVMTRGVLKPATYCYRRVFTDGVRAVEAARSQVAIDAGRIAINGASQGGGISLAVSGLVPDVTAVMQNVPFLCHYRRATEITDGYPYQEIVRYLQAHRDKEEQVFSTLAYFDGVNLASRARAKALFSVALMDEVCPPSTVFAAYNAYGGPKDIRVYRYNHHEGGGNYHTREKVQFLNETLQ